MASLLRLVLTAALAAGIDGAQESNAGVQKVIQMLNDMSAKCKQEKNDEEIAFAKFKTWCSSGAENLKTDIAKQGEEIELLTSSIGKLANDAKELGKNVAKLQKDVSKYEGDKKGATEQREKDHADFVEESTDLAESVDALDRAVEVLEKQDYDRAGGSAALLQITGSAHLPAKLRSLVSAFIGMGKDDPDLMAYEAPEANAYESQSGNLISMLKNLREEFATKLGQRQKEEMNSKHSYNMVVQDLTDSIEYANKDIDEKSSEKERKHETAANNKKQLAATIDVKAANEKSLTEMTMECKEKNLSFLEKQQLRADEIEAIAKATEILMSPDVAGNADKHLDLAQVTKTGATALVRVLGTGTASASSGGIRRRVREFLAAEGQKLHSERLSLLSDKIASNPFAKVKQLIDQMITRLLEEANADAEHEGYCDKEMGQSKITRNKLSEEIDALEASAEEGKSTIMTLTEDVAELTKELAEIDAAVEKATEMRTAEKAKNSEILKDTKAAQTAVEAATKVLKDFYETAGGATGFLQVASARGPYGVKSVVKMGTDEWSQLANPNFEGKVDTGHKEGMQTFGEKYTGQQDQAGGVLAMLEVIQSDFANLQADTEAGEAASQKEYDEFITDSKRNKAVKSRKIEMSNSDKAAAEVRLREDTADMKSTQDQLLAADRYHAKLVPQCVDKGMTFEEHQAAREAEIKSLKEALEILSSEDIETSA
jgi:hypothetical protein